MMVQVLCHFADRVGCLKEVVLGAGSHFGCLVNFPIDIVWKGEREKKKVLFLFFYFPFGTRLLSARNLFS